MNRDQLQTALADYDWGLANGKSLDRNPEAVAVLAEAAERYKRLLPQNGQWDDMTVDTIARVINQHPNVFEAARAVLAALTEGEKQ